MKLMECLESTYEFDVNQRAIDSNKVAYIQGLKTFECVNNDASFIGFNGISEYICYHTCMWVCECVCICVCSQHEFRLNFAFSS